MPEKSDETAADQVAGAWSPREPDDVPETAGLLLVRAWHDEVDQRFLARITTITDLISGSEEVTLVSSTDDVEAAVRLWLQHLSAGDNARGE
jgi:hypothetical protein